MNFFYHNDDPLLSRYSSQSNNSLETPNNVSDAYAQMYKQQLFQEMEQQQLNSQEATKDWIGSLDERLKKLSPEIMSELNNNEEFVQLNNSIQSEIQSEIISLVKFKLNNSQVIRDSIKRQMDIIDKISESAREEERRNMLEMNDYMKNYSHMTFSDYKRIKNGESVENNTEKKSKK